MTLLNCKSRGSNKFSGILRVLRLENIFSMFNKVPSNSAFDSSFKNGGVNRR